ncbi:MAG: flippase-like domain-containing protein [Bacteroidales bacterium]|nr:MAG: flippase-like domain-containing protein [Bacteroidales bacterium]
MKNKILKIANFLIFLSIGIALLYLAFRGIDFQVLLTEFKTANYFWVLLSLVISILGFIVRALRWRLLIEPLGYYPRRRNTFYAVMIGYLANFVFPRIGEITKCGSLNKSDKIPLDSLIGTVIVERSIDVITMIILVFVVFFAKINFFGNFLKTQIFNPVLKEFSGYLRFTPVTWIIISVIILGIAAFFLFFRKKLAGLPLYLKIRKIIAGVGSGLKTGFTMKRSGLFILFTIILWSLYFLMTWVVFYSLSSTSHLKAIDALFILVIGSIGITVPVQGGIGAFHWIVSLGLTLYHIPKEDGLAFATLSHESQMVLILILGSLSMIMLALNKKKSRNNE